MKNFTAFLVIIIFAVAASGCTAPLMIAGAIQGAGLAASFNAANPSSPNAPPASGTYQIEVGKYIVVLGETATDKFFNACDPLSGKGVMAIGFQKSSPSEMKEYAQFLELSIAEKQEFLKKEFLKTANFDLDPPAPVATTPAPLASSEIPTMGFH